MNGTNVRKVVSMALVLTLAAGALVLAAPSARAEPMTAVDHVGDLPEERVFAASAVFDGSVYVFGGFVSDVYGYTEDALNTVLIYDIETGETTYGADMLYGVAVPSYAVGDDGLVYVFGGYNATLFGYLPAVQIYDPLADSWVEGADAPVALGGGQAACGPDGRFYLFGSAVWYQLNSTLIYDSEADEWIYGSDQPDQIAMRMATTLNDNAIIVCGGRDFYSDTASNAVDIYDVETDSWTTASPMLEQSYLGGLAVSRDGLVYCVGGTDGTWADMGVLSSNIQIYDPETDEWWISSSHLDVTLDGFAIATDDDGRFFIVGGYTGFTTVNDVIMLFAFDAETDIIRIVSPSDGEVVCGDVTVTVSWANVWNWIDALDFYVDGSLVETQYPMWIVSEFDFFWDTTGLTDGSSHSLMVRAFMVDGSIKEDSVTVTYSTDSLEDRLESLESALAELQAALDALDEALTSLESSVDSDNQALMDEIASLKDQVTSLEDALEQTNAGVDDVKTSVDDKLAATMGYAIIGLLVVVLVLLLVMMVMGRKSAPPPPAP